MATHRFITPALHGALDYAAAVGLIVLPVLLGFGGLSRWFSIAGGIGLIGYSLLTDYRYGVTPLFSFRAHLALDLAASLAFAVAPFAFGWSGLVLGYYLVMAGGVLVVVALSRPGPAGALRGDDATGLAG